METDKVEELLATAYSNNDNSIPAWALMLIELMKELVNQVRSVNTLTNRVQKLEDCKVVNERVTEQLQIENKRLSDTIKDLSLQIDDQEQRSRNACLLFHGVNEDDADDTDNLVIDIMKSHLGVEMSMEGIQRSHRIGPKRNLHNTRAAKSKPRPIIVRFTDYRKRSEVFHAKKQMKGKAI